MKCILVNQNVEELVVEYNTTLKGFDELYEIKNINYAPVILELIGQESDKKQKWSNL